MTPTDSHTPKYIRLFCFTLKDQMFRHGTLSHPSNHIPLGLARALWIFWPYEVLDIETWGLDQFTLPVSKHCVLMQKSYHIPLRLTKALWSSGHSECNMFFNVKKKLSFSI